MGFGLRALLSSAALGCAIACQSAAPQPEAERAISDAIGIQDLVTLRVEGGPVDVPGPETLHLSHAEALRRAIENSAEIQIALAHVRSGLADADEARMLPNPVLDLIVRLPEGGGSPQIEAGISAGLLSVLQRPRRTSAADARLRSAVMEAVAVSLDVAADVREQYVDVQALDELVPLLRARRASLERSIELARTRLSFGEVARLDVITLEARAVELDLEISKAAADRSAARVGLARRIGQPSDGATWSLDAFAALPDVVEDEPRWIALALERRPELQARRFELAALGDDRSAVGSTVLDGSGIGLDAQRDGEWSVGPAVSVPLPLFDTGRARKDRADAAIIAARHGLVMEQRAVVEDVRRAYSSYRSARDDLARVEKDLLPLQRQRREQVEALYDAKEMDLTTVLLAEQDLRAAQTASIQLEKQALVSLLRLQRAVGGAVVARTLEEPTVGAGHEGSEQP